MFFGSFQGSTITNQWILIKTFDFLTLFFPFCLKNATSGGLIDIHYYIFSRSFDRSTITQWSTVREIYIFVFFTLLNNVSQLSLNVKFQFSWATLKLQRTLAAILWTSGVFLKCSILPPPPTCSNLVWELENQEANFFLWPSDLMCWFTWVIPLLPTQQQAWCIFCTRCVSLSSSEPTY